jgi:hypothetical protein
VIYKLYPERFWRHYMSMPFIYMMIIPVVILDIFLTIYHGVCFRLYKLPLVDRSKYIKIDRHRLQYLTWYEKIHCAYCGYANGVAHYFTVIAAETEKYWCGIKQAKDPSFIPPEHHKDFIDYGDEKAYRKFEK